MAFPVVENCIYGTSASASRHTITMPSSIAADEFILGFITTENSVYSSIQSSSNNFTLWGSYTDSWGQLSIIAFSGRAVGGGNDSLVLNFSTSSTIRYVVYRISGHGMLSSLDVGYNHYIEYDDEYFQNSSLYAGSNADYMYISAVAHNGSCTTLNAPTGWTGVVYNPETSQIHSNYDASIGTAYLNYNSTGIAATSWNNSPTNDVQWYITIITRIKPGNLPNATSGGIGVIVPTGRIGIN